jgi:hypothetical protein
MAAAAPAKKPAAKAPAKKSTTSASKKKTTAAKKPVAKTTKAAPKKKTAAKKSKWTPRSKRTATARRKSPSRPSVQAQPTADRYREIQQALAERGYLQSEPSGAWNAESVEAMRRFQKDQNLDPSGKLDSLSLIALGLGPKRTASTQARPQDNDYRSPEGSQRP